MGGVARLGHSPLPAVWGTQLVSVLLSPSQRTWLTAGRPRSHLGIMGHLVPGQSQLTQTPSTQTEEEGCHGNTTEWTRTPLRCPPLLLPGSGQDQPVSWTHFPTPPR